jgi:paraquat-inducible protein A
MFTNRPDWEHKVTALTLAGIILFILANVFPFIGLETAGQVQNSNLIGGVQALIQREEFLLASIVFITIFLFPLLELLGIFYILLCRFMNIRAPFIGIIVHMLHISKPWGMLEIFLVGVAVASLKLGNFADIILGPGIYAFFGLVLALIANNIYLSREDIWDWLKHENFYSIKEDEDVISCHCCQAHIGISLLEDNNECPRCGTHIHTYQPHSIQKTTALLIAALLLYIPSNLLPIMTTTHLGQVNTDTLMSGVLHLIQSGDIPIAIVVFFASIVVPITKLIVMSYLLWNVSINFTGEPKQMARLYRITEFVGRWSMIDVFVVTTLVALVQFGLLANIEPGGALLCFAGVVVLTMLAAETFDPKLIWNAYENKKHK